MPGSFEWTVETLQDFFVAWIFRLAAREPCRLPGPSWAVVFVRHCTAVAQRLPSKVAVSSPTIMLCSGACAGTLHSLCSCCKTAVKVSMSFEELCWFRCKAYVLASHRCRRMKEVQSILFLLGRSNGVLSATVQGTFTEAGSCLPV